MEKDVYVTLFSADKVSTFKKYLHDSFFEFIKCF
jgi:hypothetical protein